MSGCLHHGIVSWQDFFTFLALSRIVKMFILGYDYGKCEGAPRISKCHVHLNFDWKDVFRAHLLAIATLLPTSGFFFLAPFLTPFSASSGLLSQGLFYWSFSRLLHKNTTLPSIAHDAHHERNHQRLLSLRETECIRTGGRRVLH